MGHRLSKISTRTGDSGTTGLGDGSRVKKTHTRIACIGDIDELNSTIGAVLSFTSSVTIKPILHQVQNDLFDLGSEVAIPGVDKILEPALTRIEKDAQELNQSLKPLKEFILPGGNQAAALCHMARCVCRRAERSLWLLTEEEQTNPLSLKYLNRLSDLLFIACRILNLESDTAEPLWEPTQRPS
ncbi:MAG: cob(I)yrinic acid a,c-diamide adenosyltransferase [Gammaproteobacteria bacterium]|nr:cob(I)yrinic acid a,c-diamide adenosyltransferase [Gammaproteobacteria bacterium]